MKLVSMPYALIDCHSSNVFPPPSLCMEFLFEDVGVGVSVCGRVFTI